MKNYAENSPGAPIFLAYTSTGCKLVFRLLEDAAVLLGGVIMHGALPLGSGNEGTFFDIEVFKQPGKQIPIYIGHASGDSTAPWVTQELFFKSIKQGCRAGLPGVLRAVQGPRRGPRHADPDDGLTAGAQLDAQGKRRAKLTATQ